MNPSQAELARDLGLVRSRITALKQAGMPVDSIEAARAWRQQRQSVARRKRAPASMATQQAVRPPINPDPLRVEESFDAARTRREAAEADISEMRAAEQRGQLVLVTDVKAHLASKLASMREVFLQIPSRLGPVLAAETDPARVQTALQDEIYRAMALVSGAVIA